MGRESAEATPETKTASGIKLFRDVRSRALPDSSAGLRVGTWVAPYRAGCGARTRSAGTRHPGALRARASWHLWRGALAFTSHGGRVVPESELDVAKGPAEPRPLALVADDEAEVRQLVGEVLAESGFDVLYARDGLELVDVATRHRPRLIVADVMMPSMDGYTAVARLRGQPATAGIPI